MIESILRDKRARTPFDTLVRKYRCRQKTRRKTRWNRPGKGKSRSRLFVAIYGLISMNLKLHAAMSPAAHGVHRQTRNVHRASSQSEARSKSLLAVLSTLFPRKLACSNIKISEREKEREREVETRARARARRAYKRDFPLCLGRANPLKLGRRRKGVHAKRCACSLLLSVRAREVFRLPSVSCTRHIYSGAGRCRYRLTTLIGIFGLVVEGRDVIGGAFHVERAVEI